jgi:N-acetylglucosamine kinase
LYGCADTIGGARGIERLDAYLHDNERSSKAIVEAWAAGERTASRTVEIFIELVADPLALAINIVNADIVPVAGGLANARQLIDLLDKAVRDRVVRKRLAPIVVPASCPDEAGLVGAALVSITERR